MFTGIVQGLKTITAINDEPSLRRIKIALGELAADLKTGASVAVNGTCLTVTGVAGTDVRFDVIQETLDNTNLGELAVGDLVNVERSFRVGDEIGGHILSGHVSGVVEICRADASTNLRTLWFKVPTRWMKYLHHKGFVSLDGASLTIASVDDARCEISVSLIPETIDRTTLGGAPVGSLINLEVDAQTQAVVETVERVLSSPETLARFRSPA
ncbi:MAG: riboflavin synthase subunit alpha [Proteobacteria bacterium]|nr:riboflavin synthase subunit alpha [Pseudomonadota bacterium]